MNRIVCLFWWTVLVGMMLITTIKPEGTHIWKCCFKGEQLHTNGRDCVTRPREDVDPFSNANESTLEIARTRPEQLYWLPPELMDRDLSVHYASVYFCHKFLVLSANDTSQVSFGEEMNVTLRILDETGSTIERIIEPGDFCLDATDGPRGPWAIRMCVFNVLPKVDKCCPQGQLIMEQEGTANCVENLNMTVNGEKGVKKMNTDPFYAYNSYSLCSPGKLQTFRHPNITPEFMAWFLKGQSTIVEDYMWRYMCLDVELGGSDKNGWIVGGGGNDSNANGNGNGDGGADLRWVPGYCAVPVETFPVLPLARYLSVPSAALLAAALVATLLQARTRSSTHGRALACHAGSLMVAHAAAAANNLGGEDMDCQTIALVINFFLLAAAFWLQIICINMTHGFSQMLRSKRTLGKKSNAARAFLLYSLYGWGCPTVVTIIIVSTLSDYKFSAPLYHTKTCFYEDGPVSRTRKSNTFLYYYAPVCIILLTNIAMFVYSALKIRSMRKDTAILNRKDDGQPSGTRQSAVLYVKLLLLMGVLEAAADVAAWASKNADAHDARGVRLTDKSMAFNAFVRRELTYRAAAQALDLLRAASVFALCCCGRDARAALARWMPCCARGGAKAAKAPAVGRTETSRRRFLSWMMRTFRSSGRLNFQSPTPRLSVETVVTTLDGQYRATSDS